MTTNEADLSIALGNLAPYERQVLLRIVETLDVIEAAGREWLLVPADAALLHCLAMFESFAADLEPETDDDRHNDMEPDIYAD